MEITLKLVIYTVIIFCYIIFFRLSPWSAKYISLVDKGTAHFRSMDGL